MPEPSLMDQLSTAELLGRIDERTQNTEKAVHRIDLKIDSFTARLNRVETAIEGLQPVKRVVYGLIGLILMAVAGAIIALVVHRTP